MELPPWLNFSPQTFVAAGEAGVRARQQDQQLGLEGQRLAQESAQANAQLGMEAQRLQASQRQAGMEAQVQREQILSNFNRSQTQAAITSAYHAATLGLAKSKLDLEAKKLQQVTADKAATLADRQNYAMAISSGMDPKEALAKFPRAWEAGTLRSQAGQETITKHTTIPAVPGSPAVPADSGWHVPLLGWHVPGTGTVGSPAVEAQPQQTITESRKVQPGVTPAQAFAQAGPTAPAPAPAGGPSPAVQSMATTPRSYMGNNPEQPAAPQSAPTDQKFTKGQKAVQDGVTYEFDGSKWNPVQ